MRVLNVLEVVRSIRSTNQGTNKLLGLVNFALGFLSI